MHFNTDSILADLSYTGFNDPELPKATRASLNASFNAYTPSPLDPYDVAYAVGMETAQRVREVKQRREAEEALMEIVKPTPMLLGCWIDGKLRFQSRDHDAIHDYADRHMRGSKNFGNNVWVAPVGSFVDAETAEKGDSRKMRKVAKAS